MKKLIVFLLVLSLVAAASALAADYSDVFTKFDQRSSWTEAAAITFSDEGVLVNGSGVAVDGTTARITQPGTYMVTGSCADGQLLVEVTKDEKVQLVLGGLSLSCSDSAPLYVLSADKVSLTLAPGSSNFFSDGAVYTRPFEKEPNACICARDDLTINGSGELKVEGNNNNGIGCKNDLKIVSGTVTVTAVKNALKGNDSVAIKDGIITLTAGKDGIKSDNEDEPGKGYVYVGGGTLDITAADDALQGQQDVTVSGGSILVSVEGKTVNSKGTQDIAQGVINRK
ncbi:MAG: carbohydrate-binding domain-containing protein [Clostridia bacterium]|nr:carbohydrate-binding domain-containing protein [Clostridia bacterium]